MTEGWKLVFLEIQPPANPQALTDVKPLLELLERAFGCRSLGRLLNVKPSTVAAWLIEREAMSSEMQHRVISLHFLFTRAFQILSPQSTMQWLVGSEPFFQGSRPIEVLTLRGVAPLAMLLDAIAREFPKYRTAASLEEALMPRLRLQMRRRLAA